MSPTLSPTHRHRPLPPFDVFLQRMLRSAGIFGWLVFGSLGLGALGYHLCGDLPWLDSLLNAAMILTGMGPVNPMESTAGKWFAIFYALYSGVAFLTMVAVLAAPLVHRFLHRFHLDITHEA